MQAVKTIVKIAAWTLAALIVLLLIGRVAMAPLVSGAIVDWLEQQGLSAQIEDLTFDLVDGRAVLTGLTAADGGEPALALGRAELGWSWEALSERRLRIESIRVDGLDLQILRGDDGSMTIAGIDLPAPAAEGKTGAPDQPGEPLDWTLELPRFEMNDTRLCYRAPGPLDYCNTLAGLSWNGRLEFDLAEAGSAVLPLVAGGEVRLAKFESRSNELQRVLTSFDSLALESIAVETSDAVAVGLVRLETLNLFERATPDESPYIEQIETVEIRDIRLARNQLLEVAEIEILGNATDLVKSAEEGFELDTWLAALGRAPQAGSEDSDSAAESSAGQATTATPATHARRLDESSESADDSGGDSAKPDEAGESTAAGETAPADGGFAFTLGRFVLRSEKPLQYRDLSLDQPFVIGISTTELVVESLDSRKPETPSDITYQAQLDGDSLFELAGTITPLAEKISFDITGQVRALDLRRLSPFTAANIGHRIESGQLDADIELKAEKAIVNGKLDLTLYHFDLAALSEADAAAMEAEFGFPLGPTLSLLKNREGNIVLDVPLSGDLQNPDFGTGKIISKELSKAITTAVLTFYTPFGLITAADTLFSLATALRFDPVEFDAGVGDLGDGSRDELDKIATLMLERPGIQIRLCPHTNQADREALLPDTARTGSDEVELKSSHRAALTELGEARFAAIENYLAGKQVDPARVVPCEPKHVEGEGLAGVEISV